ncbi:hypothetical protein NE236_10250 [Actinoallomurus purpureus]|uniref:hypothetical protein n=1 Tax=Actinoallomurus purpureus TaxID=478114 RepID=UPI0020937262|nr:hypothetical protein [Actinoallomurus purpureus]MCO6005366.1 hypothetical protein [Actinoallomurus purpureus]
MNETEALPVGDSLRSLLHALGVPAQRIPDTFDSLARVLLTMGETERARDVWASARSVMLTFQNGGADGMRLSPDELGQALGALENPAPGD